MLTSILERHCRLLTSVSKCLDALWALSVLDGAVEDFLDVIPQVGMLGSRYGWRHLEVALPRDHTVTTVGHRVALTQATAGSYRPQRPHSGPTLVHTESHTHTAAHPLLVSRLMSLSCKLHHSLNLPPLLPCIS